MGSSLKGFSKVTDAHTSMTEAAREVVTAAEKLVEVTKIRLGVITPRLPPGQKRLKFRPITGGLLVVVRGVNSKQELYIYTRRPWQTESALKKVF